MANIPIISLWMPWANWVALTWKPIESREHNKFRSLVGKRVGIHASAKWDKTALQRADKYLTERQKLATRYFLRVGGAVICTAMCVETRELTKADEQGALIECESVQRHGLFFQDVQIIEAIPMKGKQGIWYAEI